MQPVPQQRLPFPTLIVAVVLIFLPMAYVGLNRFVAADEGFYLMAAKLAINGRVPYLDFYAITALLLWRLDEAFGIRVDCSTTLSCFSHN